MSRLSGDGRTGMRALPSRSCPGAPSFWSRTAVERSAPDGGLGAEPPARTVSEHFDEVTVELDAAIEQGFGEIREGHGRVAVGCFKDGVATHVA